MGTRLFVGNLSYNVTELELKEAFTSEGIEVRSVRVACEREPAARAVSLLLKRQPTTVPSKLSKNSAVTWFKAAR